jgi:hypothetical protein
MAEAEYWRFTVARDCQKKNTSENHSGYSLPAIRLMADGLHLAASRDMPG